MRVYRSKKSFGLATAGICAALALSLSAVSPAMAEPQQSTAEQLTGKVTTDGVYRHLQAFQGIADANGGNREAGTAGYQKSVDYVVNALTEAGFAVSTPKFTFPTLELGTVKFAVAGTDYQIDFVEGAAGTASGGVNTKLSVAAANGCAAEDYPASAEGSVALVQRGVCSVSTKRNLAAAAGAAGVIAYNNVPGAFSDTIGMPAGKDIPVATLSQEDGQILSGKDGSEAFLEARIEEKQVVTQNIIAETRTGRTDNAVLAGAHLDSKAGAGINDNGSGSAALLETALQLGGSPNTENTVRFAWWGAEELGLLGSADYVDKLSTEQQLDIALYMNFDMIASSNPGYFIQGDSPQPDPQEPLGSKSIVKVFADYLQDAKGLSAEKSALDGSSDHASFTQAGIATAALSTGTGRKMAEAQAEKWGGQANQSFDPNYHRAGDDVNNISLSALGINSATMAWAIGTFAEDASPVNGIPSREQRAESRAKTTQEPAA